MQLKLVSHQCHKSIFQRLHVTRFSQMVVLVLVLLWTNAKTIPMMEKWFGRIVTQEEYQQGPICPQDEVIPNPTNPNQSDPG